MKSTTIFEAYSELEFRNGQVFEAFLTDLDPRQARQLMLFRETVARRLDERDTLRAELAEARAFISSIIDAPKDYPAEASE